MPWTSNWKAQFTKPLVRQLIAIIYRDIQSALDDVSGVPSSLPPFAEYDLAHVPIKNWPALLLVPASDSFDADAENTRHGSIQLFCSVAVQHQDRNFVTELAEDYMRAVDEVLCSAWELTANDFYTQLALPAQLFGSAQTAPGLTRATTKLENLFVQSHAYSETKQTSRGSFMAATMTILAELEEA